MKKWLLIIILCLLPGVAGATLYSCRDRDGRLYVSDNLQTLPDECRAVAKPLRQDDPDNLHYLPERTPAPTVNPAFEQQLQEQQQRRQEQQQAAQRMTTEAQELLATYQQAQQDRRNALRRWGYQSRQTIQQSQQQIVVVRADKKRLLAELRQWRFADDVSSRIRQLLDQIDDAD